MVINNKSIALTENFVIITCCNETSLAGLRVSKQLLLMFLKHKCNKHYYYIFVISNSFGNAIYIPQVVRVFKWSNSQTPSASLDLNTLKRLWFKHIDAMIKHSNIKQKAWCNAIHYNSLYSLLQCFTMHKLQPCLQCTIPLAVGPCEHILEWRYSFHLQ